MGVTVIISEENYTYNIYFMCQISSIMSIYMHAWQLIINIDY